MSSRTLVLALAAGACLLLMTSSAQAQLSGFYQGSSDNPVGPTVSPYLNLLNQSGSFGATNYQSLVRPLIEQGNAINRQGSSINRLQGQVNSASAAAAGGGSRGTGHASFFMNYSHFYPAAAPR